MKEQDVRIYFVKEQDGRIYFDTTQSDNDTEDNGGYSCIHQSRVTYGGAGRIQGYIRLVMR